MMTMTFAPAARRDLMLFCHSSQTFCRHVSESASSRDLIGSSMMMSSAGLPVIPERIPRDNMTPLCGAASSMVSARSISPIRIPNSLSQRSLIFCLLRLMNRPAKSSLYAATMTRQSGCLPSTQDGRDSVTVIDLPC